MLPAGVAPIGEVAEVILRLLATDTPLSGKDIGVRLGLEDSEVSAALEVLLAVDLVQVNEEDGKISLDSGMYGLMAGP